MAFDAIIALVLLPREKVRHLDRPVGLSSLIGADEHICHEHLPASCPSVAVVMRVGAVDGKVDGLAPHATAAETHVEPFLSSVDKARVCVACAMVEDLNLGVLTVLNPQLLSLVLEDFP